MTHAHRQTHGDSELDRDAGERHREAAEESREIAEAGRASRADMASDAETDRDTAETGRTEAELLREAREALRIEAEAARKLHSCVLEAVIEQRAVAAEMEVTRQQIASITHSLREPGRGRAD